jgi:hypothetical protein
MAGYLGANGLGSALHLINREKSELYRGLMFVGRAVQDGRRTEATPTEGHKQKARYLSEAGLHFGFGNVSIAVF